jgi:hypothetical protein
VWVVKEVDKGTIGNNKSITHYLKKMVYGYFKDGITCNIIILGRVEASKFQAANMFT